MSIVEFKSNPLNLFVEIPDELDALQYNNIYCGIIRGAFEMIHVLLGVDSIPCR